MADWGRILGHGLDFLTGAAAGALVERWLNDDFQDALGEIAEFINASPAETIDMMDQMLLMKTMLVIDPERRENVVKFYAYYKIAEFAKFGRFRGFPKLDL